MRLADGTVLKEGSRCRAYWNGRWANGKVSWFAEKTDGAWVVFDMHGGLALVSRGYIKKALIRSHED